MIGPLNKIMTEDSPSIVLIAGPNGAGKSTAAPALLRDALGVTEFVNADVIARGLSAFDPEGMAFGAGRLMLSRLRELAARQASFAFETTLASRSFAPWIADLKDEGYAFHLVFLWLPGAEAAITRVAERVRTGGHDVPAETIRRRYEAGLRNLFSLYMPLATSWRVYDNSSPGDSVPIATGNGILERSIANPEIWDGIKSGQHKS